MAPRRTGAPIALAARLALLAFALAGAGCVIHHPPAPDREAISAESPSLEASQWPQRYPRTIFPVSDRESLEAMRRFLGPLTRDGAGDLAGRAWSMRHLGVYARSYLTEVVLADPDAGARRGPGWSRMLWAHGSTLSPSELGRMVRRDGPFLDPGERGYLTIARLYEPIDAEPRGLIVHQTGISGLTSDANAVHIWRERGWRVLVIAPPANIIKPDDPLLGQEPLETAPGMTDDAALAALGERLAREIDSRLAEWAYTVEAVLARLEEEGHGRLQPVVLSGLSLGAIALPATAARLPDRFDAAVLVAGGANVLRILERSPIARGGVRIRHEGGKLTRRQWRQVVEAYLEHTRLDPYAAAGALADVPVLQMHARFDQLVPAEMGELLHRRLGRPERLSYPVSHVVMAWLLPSQAGRIERWMSRALDDAVR